MGVALAAALKRGTCASTLAMKPFMSVAPRPTIRLSLCVAVKGGLVQFCPATGTTSVCADSTMPGRSAGPMVARIDAFVPVTSGMRREAMPCRTK
jgi:hypothetical protein